MEKNVLLVNVKEGDICPVCGGKLYFEKGIEVGNTFKLGTKYSEPMGATFIDKDGKTKIYNGTDEIYKALEYAQEVGIKYFVRDGNLFHTPKENFKNV